MYFFKDTKKKINVSKIKKIMKKNKNFLKKLFLIKKHEQI